MIAVGRVMIEKNLTAHEVNSDLPCAHIVKYMVEEGISGLRAGEIVGACYEEVFYT